MNKILTFLALMLVSTTALAADVVQQAWWQVLIADLLQVFVAIAVPVLSTLVVVLARRWKMNLEFDKVNAIALKAAGWAEQKAYKALREGQPQSSSAEKLDTALEFAKDLANKYKLPAKATEKLEDLIEAALGEKKVQDGGVIVLDSEEDEEPAGDGQ